MLFPTKVWVKQRVNIFHSYGLAAVGAVLLGGFIGVSTVYLPVLIYAGLAGMATAVFGWYAVQRTHWTVASFFLAFAVQTTLLAGFEMRGLYYPIYLLMLLNAVLGLMSGHVRVSPGILVPYLLFLAVMIMSLFNLATPSNFEVYQRLFIYLLGLCVFFQFASGQAFQTLMQVQMWAAFVVAIWVILTAWQSGFGERGIAGVDPNNVTATIALGVVPLFAWLMVGRISFWRRIAGWLLLGVTIYASLLLASRGVTVALALSVVMMIARVLHRPRRSVPLIIIAILAVVLLTNLPGSNNLMERFGQSDVTSANGRVPLWNAAIQEVLQAAPLELLFGHGFNYTLIVTSRVVGFYYSVHNTYLQLLLDVGLLGLALFLFLHFMVLKTLWRRSDALALYGIGTVVFLLLINLTLQAADGFLYWVALGTSLAVAAYNPTR
jgi:O-antigen ligase